MPSGDESEIGRIVPKKTTGPERPLNLNWLPLRNLTESMQPAA
jgi:hypothetical protein